MWKHSLPKVYRVLDTFHIHDAIKENIIENMWEKPCNLVCFLIADSGGNSWCPCKSGEIMLKAVKKYRNDKESIKSSERVKAGEAWKSSNREGSKTTCDWR